MTFWDFMHEHSFAVSALFVFTVVMADKWHCDRINERNERP